MYVSVASSRDSVWLVVSPLVIIPLTMPSTNSLPDDVTSAPSLSTFRRHLKTYLFRCCYNTARTFSDYSGPRGGVAA